MMKCTYDIHPAVAYSEAVLRNLATSTGRSLRQWLRVIEDCGYSGEKEIARWLKAEHNLGATTAKLLASRACRPLDGRSGAERYLENATAYVDAMYAGKKSHLRPIHDHLVEVGRSFGKAVRVCPCRTIVPLYREHVFAEIKPATQKRIDLGLALRHSERELPDRIHATRGLKLGDRITHRIVLECTDDVDEFVCGWMGYAYELDR